VDEQGARALAVMAEAYRRGMSVSQLQSDLGVVGDGLVGPATWAACAEAMGVPEQLLGP
jgi:hypothetical protein